MGPILNLNALRILYNYHVHKYDVKNRVRILLGVLITKNRETWHKDSLHGARLRLDVCYLPTIYCKILIKWILLQNFHGYLINRRGYNISGNFLSAEVIPL